MKVVKNSLLYYEKKDPKKLRRVICRLIAIKEQYEASKNILRGTDLVDKKLWLKVKRWNSELKPETADKLGLDIYEDDILSVAKALKVVDIETLKPCFCVKTHKKVIFKENNEFLFNKPKGGAK